MSEKTSSSACCVWDVTISKEQYPEMIEVKNWFKKTCKKWGFQLERGASGYEHWQCRVSLKVKSRKPMMPRVHESAWSVTSNANKDNLFYVFKEDTHIDGPWCDTDVEVYIPRQFRNKTLYPWQLKVIEISKTFNDREINVIYDPVGNKGKSTLAAICELEMNGIDLPPVNDAKELLQVICDICLAKQDRSPNPVFVDIPRAMEKSRLHGIYTAIEQIKKGKLVDMRYHYKEWWIDSPCVWVCTNTEPDLHLMSNDRWKVWEIVDNQLREFKTLRCNNIIKLTGTIGTNDLEALNWEQVRLNCD